jgi:xylose isomerase
MKPLKISMGIWGINNLPDRFNVQGFGDFVPVIDRIKIIGETSGVDGIELHLPTEIDDSNVDEIEKVLKDYNLQIVQLCGHTWTEKQYKNGALADLDPKIRQSAIDRVKAALDMGARLYKLYIDSVQQIMAYLHQNNYTTKICLEPKPFEPRSHILYGTTGQALCLVNEIDDPSFGINLDIGHSLIASENVEDQVALICHYGKLFHTHFDDNDQQADIDLPPGTVNFIRLVSIMYVLDQVGYDGWYGLDLFPYRDDPIKFMTLSVENLNLAKSVVNLMKERGAEELRAQSGKGPEMSILIRDCIRQAE